VAYNILKKHGGYIGAESSGVAGEGSRFFFYIPVSSSPVSEPQRAPSHGSRTPATFNSDIITPCGSSDSATHRILKAPRYRALVVDDSSLNRKMLKNVVKRYFTAVLEVSNEMTMLRRDLSRPV
jgi:hypothetical protein